MASVLRSSSSSEMPESVKRACSVPPRPRTRTRAAMARTILDRSFMPIRLRPQAVLSQIGAHLPDGIVDAIVGNDEAVDQQVVEDCLARRVPVHLQKDPAQLLLEPGVQAWVDHKGVDAERTPLLDPLHLSGDLWLRLHHVVEDETVDGGGGHYALRHGTNRAIVGVREDGAAEEGVGVFAHERQLVDGCQATTVRKRVGESEAGVAEVAEGLGRALTASDE